MVAYTKPQQRKKEVCREVMLSQQRHWPFFWILPPIQLLTISKANGRFMGSNQL